MIQKEMRELCKGLGVKLPTNATIRKRVAEERCVFCGEHYENIGNNPAPIIIHEEASCCNFCNGAVVLLVRLKLMSKLMGKI